MSEMYGELILIRHGKAEPQEEAVDDALRELTKNGTEELKKILPELKSHLDPESELRLCSSPLLRALQTAEIIADHLGINEIEQLDWIKSGEYTGLMKKLKSLGPSTALAVVGHEPYLSEWSRGLCGFTVPFRKGMATGFHILSTEPLRAEPEWMVLPETVSLRELNIKRGQPALQEFQKILRLQLLEIFRMLRKFLYTPDDPETAHQFRVKIRAFRSLLSFIKPLLDWEQYQRVQAQMKNLSQMMGRLREIDVMKSEWDKLLEAHPELIRQKSVLTAVLTSERQKEQTEIFSGMPGTKLSVIFDIWNWIDNLSVPEAITKETIMAETNKEEESKAEEAGETEGKEKPEKPQSFEDFSGKRMESWMKKAGAGLKTLDYNDFSAVHALRIRFKKLRYTLNALNPILHLESKGVITALKTLQDLLGTYCDAERNLSILRELNVSHASPGMYFESGILVGYQVRVSEETLDEIRKIQPAIFRRHAPAT